MLGETRFAVDWLAYCRLERDHGNFVAVCAFNFEHSFLERDIHLC
jgi:hypothetical protein